MKIKINHPTLAACPLLPAWQAVDLEKGREKNSPLFKRGSRSFKNLIAKGWGV